MAIQNNGGIFVVKDRIEALEARIETALDEAGLKGYSRQVAGEAISEVVGEIINELRAKKNETLEAINVERLEVNDRLEETRRELNVAIVNHIARLESSTLERIVEVSVRIDRLETLVKISLIGAIGAILLSLLI